MTEFLFFWYTTNTQKKTHIVIYVKIINLRRWRMFNKKQLLKQAKKLKKIIVFPEAGFSDRTIQAAKILKKKKIVDVLLVGDDSALVLRDKSLVNFNIVNPKTSSLRDKLVKLLLAKRKDKGLTKEEAEELVLNPYYFATLLVEMGVADGMVSGAESPTAQTVRPALQILGSAKKGELVSSCMLMFGKNKFLKDKTLKLVIVQSYQIQLMMIWLQLQIKLLKPMLNLDLKLQKLLSCRIQAKEVLRVKW